LEQVFESFDEWAQAMGHNEAAKLLEQTLKEEKAADEKPVARRTPSSTSDRRRHLRTTKTSAYRASDAGAWPRGGGGLEVASSPLHSGRTR
jgi:hypothetical protein